MSILWQSIIVTVLSLSFSDIQNHKSHQTKMILDLLGLPRMTKLTITRSLNLLVQVGTQPWTYENIFNPGPSAILSNADACRRFSLQGKGFGLMRLRSRLMTHLYGIRRGHRWNIAICPRFVLRLPMLKSLEWKIFYGFCNKNEIICVQRHNSFKRSLVYQRLDT